MKVSKIIFILLFSVLFISPFSTTAQTQTAQYYNVTAGNGYGLRFWSSNSYKIHMGNTTEYRYGPVTNYSIKMNMNSTAGRGWTWGISGQQPVTALSNAGHFQTKGYIRTMNRNLYLGSVQRLYGDNSSQIRYYSNHSTVTAQAFYDKEGTRYGLVYGSGNGVNFGLLDGDGNWSYLAAKDSYTAFRINNSEKMRIKSNGYVGIGATNPQYKLDVCGTVRSKEVIVESGWCDYVFEKDYDLPTLDEEKKHIEDKGHLIGFESEEEMNGEIIVGDVTKRQQQKIEEAMLHLIQLNEENKVLKKQNEELNSKYQALEKMVSELKAQIEK